MAGALTSRKGADFAAICAAMQNLGYRFGALTIDAAHFLPQSRPRVFFIALRQSDAPHAWLVSPGPSPHHASAALKRAVSVLPPSVAADWLWWRIPEPPRANLRLADCLDDDLDAPRWHSVEQTERLLEALSLASRRDVALARKDGKRAVGALFRRTRPDGMGGVRVQAEARFDGKACRDRGRRRAAWSRAGPFELCRELSSCLSYQGVPEGVQAAGCGCARFRQARFRRPSTAPRSSFSAVCHNRSSTWAISA